MMKCVLRRLVSMPKNNCRNRREKYRVFQIFESPSSLNLPPLQTVAVPDCGLFNSTVLRD